MEALEVIILELTKEIIILERVNNTDLGKTREQVREQDCSEAF